MRFSRGAEENFPLRSTYSSATAQAVPKGTARSLAAVLTWTRQNPSFRIVAGTFRRIRSNQTLTML